MKRWLWSSEAIQVHALCLTSIAVLSFALWSGERKDYAYALVAVVIAYPVLLWLIRSKERADEREMQTMLALPAAEARRQRAAQRVGMTVFTILAGGLLIGLGVFGVEAYGLPAHYIGFLLLGTAALGVCGVNVWYGGPLDPRHDPRIEDDHV